MERFIDSSGIWKCHQHVGECTAALVTAWVLANNVTYRMCAFNSCRYYTILWGFLTHCLVASEAKGPTTTTSTVDESTVCNRNHNASKNEGNTVESVVGKGDCDDAEPMTLVDALSIPIVLPIRHCLWMYSTRKLRIVYFWLPYFLRSAL